MTENKHELTSQPPGGQFLVYEAEDGQIKIEVRLEGETVWLTQRLLAELFQKDVRTINHHIQNVYDEGELAPEATIRKYRIVQIEGKHNVAHMAESNKARSAFDQSIKQIDKAKKEMRVDDE